MAAIVYMAAAAAQEGQAPKQREQVQTAVLAKTMTQAMPVVAAAAVSVTQHPRVAQVVPVQQVALQQIADLARVVQVQGTEVTDV